MQGYYRQPTIFKNQLVFVSEDDLWKIEANNLKAIRLTANNSEVYSPMFSPDGKYLAYIGTEDGGTEIYIMPSNGGPSKRLTYDGAIISKIALWKNDTIYYTSTLESTIGRVLGLRTINFKGGYSTGLQYGTCTNISISKYGTVLGKNTADPARWKRYKGGTAGNLLIDLNNKSIFKKLFNIKGNIACPMWIEKRIYFISDHEGIGNIYSCNKFGKNIIKHTHHKNYYVRNATTDGQYIAYHAGADIFILNSSNNSINKINIDYASSKIQTSRKYVDVNKYLEGSILNNKNNYINLVSRGKTFTMGNWNGPVYQHGEKHGIRYKHSAFLNNNTQLLLISDKNNTENIEIHNIKSNTIKRSNVSCGRIINVKKSPKDDMFVLINHKHEIHLYNSIKDNILKIDRSKHDFVSCNWSPDGRFVVYNCSSNSRCSIIKVYDIKNKKIHNITKPINKDYSPIFSSDGKYLAFISTRTFNPTYDNIQFDLSFQKGERPYIITLSKDTQSPFIKSPDSEDENKDKKESKDNKDSKDSKDKIVKTKIDFNGIENRIMEIPIDENILSEHIGFSNDKLFYIVHETNIEFDENSLGTLKYYDLKNLEEKVFISKVSSFYINKDKILISDNKSLRLLPIATPPNKEILQITKHNSKSGLIDLSRIKLEIKPTLEWKQMYSEAWRLQRDYFWVSNMSGINWKKIYDRYYSLIERLGSRAEFSDLIWEMQGELGTSHCYEMGGDYKARRNYKQGHFGAQLHYDDKHKSYKVTTIYRGDFWESPHSSLLRPGVNIKEGDYIRAINGNRLSKSITPGHLLVNLSNNEVDIDVLDNNYKNSRHVTVKTISDHTKLVYRDWVESNKKYVHKKSKGKIGYIHIPDMSVYGFAEFHRHFLSEISYDGLVVDVRYNGGGHVSQLLLSKLARKRLGFDLTRWMGDEPYPVESPGGPMVAVTNEYAGSDGDIFSHSWKMMKLGKLIGKRTWGGVIGIWPRNSLVDGTMTTQPEFSFWFKDVGWGVENYGADVDIEIDNLPQDHMKNIDNQLNKAIDIVLNDLKKKGSVLKPAFKDKPNLKLP